MGEPPPPCVAKTLASLDRHCRAFIGRSPFVLIASAIARGQIDISPKGDAPGFVRILDDHTLAVPDRPGNRRADTFTNILETPTVGLTFLIPGKTETHGKVPDLRAGCRDRRGLLSLLEVHHALALVEARRMARA
jgi:uncharacterized protein